MQKYRISALLVLDEGRLVGICTERDCTRSAILEARPAKSTPVREAMTPHPISIAPDNTIEDCMSLMTHKRVRHLPVMDEGKLVGIVSIGDVVRAAVSEKNFMIDQLERYITTSG